MMDVEREQYREMANEIRAVVPMMKNIEAAMDLRLLALRYDRLAKQLEESPEPEYKLQVTDTSSAKSPAGGTPP
jgi:hypothetical protein